MGKTMRDELLFFDGAFRAIMMATKDMSIEDNTTFQYALDSIDYILKSDNWLDDEWVKVGFENIVKAKDLLNKMLNEGDYSENTCLRHVRDRLRNDGHVHPIEISLLTEEERKRADSLRKYARRAIDSHNQQEIHREAPDNHFSGLGGNGMKSLIRSQFTGQTTATEGTAVTYSSEELNRLKDVFKILRLRSCLTQAGRDVFTKAIDEVEKAMRGSSYNSQTIEAAKDLHEKILKGNGRGRSLAPGLIKDEAPTRWNHGGHDHGGHDGHGR